jgi:hypothetical protein
MEGYLVEAAKRLHVGINKDEEEIGAIEHDFMDKEYCGVKGW